MKRPRPTPEAKPWVDWCASRIDDPIRRLRFLQAVTPLTVPRPARWRYGLVAIALLAILGSFLIARATTRAKPVAAAARPKTVRQDPSAPSVWMVEKSADSETFSNGLRVDTRYESPYHARSYLAFPAARPDDGAGVRRTAPAGIVFHTTESRQLPFEATANGELKRVGENLVQYVSRRHAYHYLIDRFGRVYRAVPEADAADHAGYSVWSDDDWLYLNLNQSFFGISFETATEPGQEDAAVTPAQVHAAAMLTEMLRGRYGIPAANCVTHAQVSVNPENMRIGYHTDWASSFPFARLGLPDNYARPLPAILSFGFEYDATFVAWAGARLLASAESAEDQLARQAIDRRILRQRYRARLAEARSGADAAEGR